MRAADEAEAAGRFCSDGYGAGSAVTPPLVQLYSYWDSLAS